MRRKKPKPPVAFLIAHPDDMDHSMGGTAWMLKDTHRLHVLCATKGERGIRGKSLGQAAAIRQKEQAAACKRLGADLTFLGRIDGELRADKAICDEVAQLLEKLKPVAVFTLWPINEHPDHVAIYDIAMQALRGAGLYRQSEIYLAENAVGVQTNQFCPDIYVDISEVIEAKKSLARCHRSQNPTEDNIEDVVARNRVRGLLAGCQYAEGFKTIYPLTANGSQGRATLLLGLGATR